MKNKFTIFALITLGLLSFGLYEALVAAPTEQTMGDVQRIFYYHVPSAWVSAIMTRTACGRGCSSEGFLDGCGVLAR